MEAWGFRWLQIASLYYFFSGLVVPLARIQLALVATFLTILAAWKYFKGSTPCKNRQTKMASQSNPLWDTWAYNFHHDNARPDTATRMVQTTNELGWELVCSLLSAQTLSLQIFACPLTSKQMQEAQSLKLIKKWEVLWATGRDQSRSVRRFLCWASTEDCNRKNREPLTVFFFWTKVHIPLQQPW